MRPLGAESAESARRAQIGAMFTTVAMEFRPSNTRCGLEGRCVGAGMGFTTLIEQID